MPAWTTLLHLGDLRLTVPAAAGIAATLLLMRARRTALHWSIHFALAMLAVGLSKIAFMLWGTGIAALKFKALSGHATGAAAVLPALLYLFVQLRHAAPSLRDAPTHCVHAGPAPPDYATCAALLAGLAGGLLVALALVAAREHSMAEALAGYILGSAVSIGVLVHARPAAARWPLAGLCWFGAIFALAAWLMHPLPVSYWMIKAARLLAGPRPLHALSMD